MVVLASVSELVTGVTADRLRARRRANEMFQTPALRNRVTFVPSA
jgi:hypothetical protein